MATFGRCAVAAVLALTVYGWGSAASATGAATRVAGSSEHVAGYVVTGLSLHSLTAGWTEPTVSCSSGPSYARIVAGLSSTHGRVVVGTTFNCVDGKPVGQLVGNVFGHRTVSAGDHMTLTMDYYRGSYDVEIDDDTAGWGQGAAVDATGGPRMIHANFVVRSKAASGRSLPLANFGK